MLSAGHIVRQNGILREASGAGPTPATGTGAPATNVTLVT